MESTEFFMIPSDLLMGTLAMLSVLVFGSVLPLGTVGVLMWVSLRHDRTNARQQRPAVTGAKLLSRAA